MASQAFIKRTENWFSVRIKSSLTLDFIGFKVKEKISVTAPV